MAIPRHSGQNWTGCCITSHWNTLSLCWMEGLSTICHWDVSMADWKIKPNITTNPGRCSTR